MTRLAYPSASRAMDGGLIAVTDLTDLLSDRGIDEYLLIGGIAVLLHTQRAGLDLPQRATRDADIGFTTLALRQPGLIADIETLGYRRIRGNRWERTVDGAEATIDLLVPAYTSRPRDNVRVGDVTTIEVSGLAEAFLRPPCIVNAAFSLTDGTELRSSIRLPDAAGMLALKCGARRSRTEARDATDLWLCLEVAFVDGVTQELFENQPWADVKRQLFEEFIEPGRAMDDVVAGLTDAEATRRTTHIRGLLLNVAGISS
ncbi:MAG: hypothetical protein M3092_05850 [Actinomycetia bacterium]|nr:hypothetical protein [Actinomycetes bacterium]